MGGCAGSLSPDPSLLRLRLKIERKVTGPGDRKPMICGRLLSAKVSPWLHDDHLNVSSQGLSSMQAGASMMSNQVNFGCLFK